MKKNLFFWAGYGGFTGCLFGFVPPMLGLVGGLGGLTGFGGIL